MMMLNVSFVFLCPASSPLMPSLHLMWSNTVALNHRERDHNVIEHTIKMYTIQINAIYLSSISTTQT